MKQPTHSPHYNDLREGQPIDDAIPYLLDKIDEEKAHEALRTLIGKEMNVDAILATLMYTTALAIHCNYEDNPEGEKIGCLKSRHLGKFLHVLIHELFDHDRQEEE